MRLPLTMTAAIVLILAGCATSTVNPQPAASPARAAAVTVADVEIDARTGAWRGWPSDLGRVVTPIRMTLVNRGAVPLRVSHADFALLLVGGRRLSAVFPADVRGVVYEPPAASLPSAGFALGAEGYPDGGDWVIGRPAPGAVSDPAARVAEQFPLPTPDVLQGALREGVLPPGGTLSGFVYFDRVPAHAGPVDVAARLVDAQSGEALAHAIVPLTFP